MGEDIKICLQFEIEGKQNSKVEIFPRHTLVPAPGGLG